MRASETAFVIVDMQNGFCSEGGSSSRLGFQLSDLPATVAEIAVAKASARGLGISCIYVTHVYKEGLVDADRRALARYGRDAGRLVRGTWDAAVVDDLAPDEEDLVIFKNRYDGFFRTELEATLERMGVRQLIFAGVATNACVAMTARSAWMRDFEVMVPRDTTTARTRELKEAALTDFEEWLICTSQWREALGAHSVSEP